MPKQNIKHRIAGKAALRRADYCDLVALFADRWPVRVFVSVGNLVKQYPQFEVEDILRVAYHTLKLGLFGGVDTEPLRRLLDWAASQTTRPVLFDLPESMLFDPPGSSAPEPERPETSAYQGA